MVEIRQNHHDGRDDLSSNSELQRRDRLRGPSAWP
jgi:hypothetical protein